MAFLLRDVAATDLDDLQAAAIHLDSVNLPDDREALARIIDISTRSFAGQVPLAERCFVFVARDEATGHVVGTSMIFAQHGSRRAPHVFFDVIEEERYSETLDRHFAHRLLRIGYNYKGLTEIGGLVLRPEYRGHPQQLGRLLVYVRFLYMGLHRATFCDEVVSELMPPLEADGTSLLWESLGRKFTGLTYQEADALSRQNKEFIRTLFPQDPLYATLLPAEVQRMIGEVGPETKSVERMLRQLGFEYANRIDPFDGGPHFHARTDDISVVRGLVRARVALAAPGAPGGSVLVAREEKSPPCFLAARIDGAVVTAATTTDAKDDASVAANSATLALPAEALPALHLAPGDEVAFLPLPTRR
ncbi:MAG: Arginine N-succinyltransferase [Myxococcales bacterium]|nr:Arginine N-succinyltransferase [Myxococcales bacterium]